MNALRVFLVDDHAVVREGLKKLINDHAGMTVVGEAEDGRNACHEVLRLHPDITIMDISMPMMNGVEATRRLKSLCPETKILALTVHEDLSYLNEIMQAGASGYALKRAAGGELIHALSTVASGGTYLDPNLASKVVSSAIKAEPERTNTTALSIRETDVVRLIAEGHSNKEIATRLHISDKSVETYKARAMAKLGFRGRADIVSYSLEKGWLKPS
jgi:DNA-binding NarL/FixJ family response regulator